MLTVVPSQRTGCFNSFIYGYRYRKNNTLKETEYYLCVEKNCNSSITNNKDHNAVLIPPRLHNHMPVDSDVLACTIRFNMLNEAAKNQTKTRREIYENELMNWKSDDENYPNFAQVRRVLCRARRKVMPSISRTFFGEWNKTGKTFLFLQKEGLGIIEFSTRYFIEKLCDNATIIADRTFRSARAPFAQLYVIFGVI